MTELHRFESAYEPIGIPALLIQVVTGVWLLFMAMVSSAGIGCSDDSEPTAPVTIVAACIGGVDGNLEEHIQGHGHAFTITRLRQADLEVAFAVRGIPTYVLLDKRGHRVVRRLGYWPSASAPGASSHP